MADPPPQDAAEPTILCRSTPFLAALTGEPSVIPFDGRPVPSARGDLWLLLDVFDPILVADVLSWPGVRSVTAVYVHRGYLCAGPVFRPGLCPCPVDLVVRGHAAAGVAPALDALVTTAVRQPEALASQSPLRDLTPDALREIWASLRGAFDGPNGSISGTVAALDMLTGALNWHRLIPLPGPVGHLSQLRDSGELAPILREAADRLASGLSETDNNGGSPQTAPPDSGEQSWPPVDPLFGPVVGVKPLPDAVGEPTALVAYSATVAEVGRYLRWRPDQNGTGMNFAEGPAQGAAFGEAIERYAGQVRPPAAVGSERELVKGGRRITPVTAWEVFTSEQYDDPSFRYQPRRPEDQIEWLTATDLSNGQQVLVPASVAVLGEGGRRLGPRTVPPLAGVAAGRNAESALSSGILELLERDATMTWWHRRHPAMKIDLSGSDTESLLRDGADPRVDVWWLLLSTPSNVPVVAACLHDTANHIVNVGFAARFDVRDAAAKAAAEAWQLRRISLALLDEQSWLWTHVRSGQLRYPLLPYRADRRYRDGLDQTRMRNLTYNLQYYLDPEALEEALPLLRAANSVSLKEITASEPPVRKAKDGGLPDLVRAVSQAGWRVFGVDLTTSDVAALGMRVQRALSPDMCPNTAAGAPPLGHPRLRDDAGGELNLLPLPHA